MINEKNEDTKLAFESDVEEKIKQSIRNFFGAFLYGRFFAFNRYVFYNNKLSILCPTAEINYNVNNYHLDGIYRACNNICPNAIKVVVQHDESLPLPDESAVLLAQKDNHQQLNATSALTVQNTLRSANSNNNDSFENSLLSGNVILSNFEPKSLNKSGMNFETFIEDESNKMALLLAKCFAGIEECNGLFFENNLLFLYGDVGRGKTHLAKSIFIESKKCGISSLYLSAESFTNEFVSSLRNNSIHDFKSKITSVQTLIIDDIHSLLGRRKTIAELSKMICFILDNNKKVVLTSTEKPSGFDCALKSRISSGASVQINSATKSLRQKIVNQMVSANNIPISLADSEFLVKNITGGVRELKGAVGRISVSANLNSDILNTDHICEIVEDLLIESAEPTLIPHSNASCYVHRAVCTFLGINLSVLLSENKTRKVSGARNLGMYICRYDLQMSFQDIAHSFCRNSHNAVIAGVKSIEKKITDKKVNDDLGSVRRIVSRAKLHY
ncbi:MAG: AAA family ATPase [Alphaproteobacteria bacterium]|nr:AAA family ATPase [Rickettsiales bacterium]